MTADTSKLAKPAKKKGDMPERGKKAVPVIANDTRENEKPAKKKPLQLRVTEEEFDLFSQKAIEMFGYSKGAKSLYFSYLLNNKS